MSSSMAATDLRDAAAAPGRKLIIQIPCFNEEATLPETLADLPREVPGFDRGRVAGDRRRQQRTAPPRWPARYGVDHVVRVPREPRAGERVPDRAGHRAALGADVIVNTDADNQYDGSCIPDAGGCRSSPARPTS